LLKLKVDLWSESMEIRSKIINNKTGKYEAIDLIFDTGAYLTVIDSDILARAGYDLSCAKISSVNVVGTKTIPAREVLLKGFSFVDLDGNSHPIGPVLVYAIDMSEGFVSGVVGLNIIREFETKIKFGCPTTVELTPTFDISQSVPFNDFTLNESRFGLWAKHSVFSKDMCPSPTS